MKIRSEGQRAALRLAFVVALAACGDSSGPTTGVDLARLFAEPTAAEIAAVASDWAARTPGASDVRVELTQPFPLGATPMELRIVSHVVDGHRHYGALLAPAAAPAAPRPLVLYLHAGVGGVAVEEIGLVAASSGVDPATAVWVIPSFRSEPLRLGSQSWTSTGPPSPWDRDVDDAIALLDVAAQVVPGAARSCVASIGFSRGAGVGLLLSARDPRVRAAIAFFGPTDFFSPFIRELAEAALRGQPRELPGMDHINEAWLQPLARGEISYAEARLALLRRSPARFAERLGPVQLHHGTADEVVPVSQAQALIDAMQRIGRGAPAFEAFLYSGVGHNPLFMTSAPERVARFLGGLPAACAAGMAAAATRRGHAETQPVA